MGCTPAERQEWDSDGESKDDDESVQRADIPNAAGGGSPAGSAPPVLR